MPPGRKRKSTVKGSETPTKKTRKVGRPPKNTQTTSDSSSTTTTRKTRKQAKINEFGSVSSSSQLSTMKTEEEEEEEEQRAEDEGEEELGEEQLIEELPNTGIVPRWSVQVNHFEYIHISQDQLSQEEASIYFTKPPEKNQNDDDKDNTTNNTNQERQMNNENSSPTTSTKDQEDNNSLSTSEQQQPEQQQPEQEPQAMDTQEDSTNMNSKQSSTTTKTKTTDSKKADIQLKKQTADWSDRQDLAVLYTTGPIWTFDWCPLAQENQYAAMGCHKKEETTHIIGKAYSGSDRIAIWNFGPLASKNTPRPSPKPVMYIEHQHGICWDLKWCPSIVKRDSTEFQDILGVLFAVFSDGTLCAYVVPHPDSYDIPDQNIIQIDLNPSVEIVDTEKLMWNLSWSHENRFLACGCQDGNIAIFRLTENGFNKSQVICAHHLAVRSISWSNQCPFHFFSVGNDGTFRLWDLRDPFYPLTTVTHGRAWITDSRWPSNSSGIMFSSTDGYIRQFAMRDRRMANAKSSNNTLWAMDLSSTGQLLISASAEGSVFVQSVDKNGVVIFGRKRHKFDIPIINLHKKSESQQQHFQDQEQEQEQEHDSFHIYSEEMNIGTSEQPQENKKSKKKTSAQGKNKSKTTKGKNKKKSVRQQFPPIEDMLYVSKFHPSLNSKLKNWVFTGGAGSVGILFQMPSSILKRVK